MGQEIVIKRGRTRGNLLPGKQAEHSGPSRLPHAHAPCRVVEDLLETAAECFRVTGWYEKTGLAVGDGEGDPADPRTNDRGAARHGLQAA